MKNWGSYEHSYIRLAKDSSLKLLEKPYIFNSSDDELYELNDEAIEFLKKCDGSARLSELGGKAEFLNYLFDEGLLEFSLQPSPQEIRIGKNTSKPSLRYLMVEVTSKCNLSCLHCYQGEHHSRELPWPRLKNILQEFEDLGGLRLIVSGGEPLIYSHFAELNEFIKEKDYRKILVTNGILLNSALVESLGFDEVQVSLDGLEKGHDTLRGKGSFSKALAGLNILVQQKYPLSVATVLHRYNLVEISQLAELVKRLGAVSWTIDFPVLAGNLTLNSEFAPEPREAIKYLSLAYGAEVHSSEEGYACGSHLGCVKANGDFTKCGYYGDLLGGSIKEGLAVCWENLPKFMLKELNCECDYLDECQGGCRYRAETSGNKWGPDPIKCIQFGMEGEKNNF